MGDLLSTLVEPSMCNHPIAVTISNEGFILANYADKKGVLALFSVNGKHYRSQALEEQVFVSIHILTIYFEDVGHNRHFVRSHLMKVDYHETYSEQKFHLKLNI